MPIYVYGCDDKRHPTVEVVRGREEVIQTLCPLCGRTMHRIPQLFGFSVPFTDPGLRRTRDIHQYNLERYKKNKARREANEQAHRYASERKR